jgi:prostaglandin-E synthase
LLHLLQAEEGPYWARLLADKTKAHWLKVDFGKWKDEDDSDAEGEGGAPGGGGGGGDLEEMMKNMGGLGGGGMGGMGGMPGMGGMGGEDPALLTNRFTLRDHPRSWRHGHGLDDGRHGRRQAGHG